MAQLPVRPGHLRQRGAVMPVLRRSALQRRRGGGCQPWTAPGEFRGVCLSRASCSAIRSRACASSTAARASAACDPAGSARSQATSAASTSSPEPASSPGTPGRRSRPRSRASDPAIQSVDVSC